MGVKQHHPQRVGTAPTLGRAQRGAGGGHDAGGRLGAAGGGAGTTSSSSVLTSSVPTARHHGNGVNSGMPISSSARVPVRPSTTGGSHSGQRLAPTMPQRRPGTGRADHSKTDMQQQLVPRPTTASGGVGGSITSALAGRTLVGRPNTSPPHVRSNSNELGRFSTTPAAASSASPQQQNQQREQQVQRLGQRASAKRRVVG